MGDLNHIAWARSMISFIRAYGLESEFKDYCGGWPCPVASLNDSPWQPIETAPKDRPILAYCRSGCSEPRCAFSDVEYEGLKDGKGSYSLCLFHGHAEGMSTCGDGLQIIEWGGSWDDSTWEYPGGNMPDWWFRAGSEFEESANPTHWMPLPDAPVAIEARQGRDGEAGSVADESAGLKGTGERNFA